MAYDTLHDLFLSELKDLHSAETQLLEALPLMTKAATTPELREAFSAHLADTRNQVDRLDTIFTKLNITGKIVSCKAMEGLLEEAEETLKKKGNALVLDAAMVGAAARVEHYEIAAYTSAIALGRTMKHTEAVKLLEASLAEEKAALDVMTGIKENTIFKKAPSMPTAGSGSR